MSLRLRLTLVAAAAVAIAVVIAAAGMYLAVRQQLYQQVDTGLTDRAADMTALGPRPGGGSFRPPPRGPAERFGFSSDVRIQIVSAQGQVLSGPDQAQPLPVPAGAADVASGTRPAFFDEIVVQGTHLRVLVSPFAGGTAAELARPIDEIDTTLDRLRLVLATVVLGGVLLALALGYLITRSTLRPLRQLAAAVDTVTTTGDLSRRVPSGESDEVARLGSSFNGMLAALDASLRSQRQLVADASHELRTPITSLRTNLELLSRGQPIDPGERSEVLADVVGQLERLSRLVADLIDLARDEQSPIEMTSVPLDAVVRHAVEAAAGYWPAVQFEVQTEPTTVRGDAARIDRALMNLLDNAAKWSPAGGRVDVSTAAGVVVVRDHGPGIPAVDAAHVFDRFWRSPAARSMPGSGLGLAIVREVAERHGGSVTLEHPIDGGALFRLRLLPDDAGRPRPAAAFFADP